MHQGQHEIINDSTFMEEETEVGLLYLIEGNKERQYCYPHPEDGACSDGVGWRPILPLQIEFLKPGH